MNNRPDLLTEASLSRIFKIYLEKIETPTLKLSKPTTKIVVDPSVNIHSLRLNKSVHSLLQLCEGTSNSQIEPIKHSLMLNKSSTQHFVEHVNMLQ